MGARERPWMKFYPADWRADPMLRNCSLLARGLWLEVLALMHESERYGYLLVNGKQPSERQLAVQVGASIDEVQSGLAELETEGVFSRDRVGLIYSRRMIRDEKKSRFAQKTGKMGGNPKLLEQREKSADDKGQDEGDDMGHDKTHMPEARSQSSEDKESSGDSAAQEVDPRKLLFDAGVALLTAAGSTESQARSLVGKWRAQVGDDEVRIAIAEAKIAGVSDPIPYLSKRFANFRPGAPRKGQAPHPNDFVQTYAQEVASGRAP